MAKVEQKEEKNNKTIYNIGYKEQAIRREKMVTQTQSSSYKTINFTEKTENRIQ